MGFLHQPLRFRLPSPSTGEKLDLVYSLAQRKSRVVITFCTVFSYNQQRMRNVFAEAGDGRATFRWFVTTLVWLPSLAQSCPSSKMTVKG